MVEIPSASPQMGPGGGWLLGPGSYVYEQRGLFDGTISRSEMKHLGLTGLIGLAFANPVVSIGVGLVHWNYHILKPLVSDVFEELTSSGGGGPGEVLNSAAPPSITYRGGRPQGIGRTATTSLVGRRSGAKPRCRAEYRGETGRYKSPVRCAKRMGHRGKHRSGRFTWKG